MLAFEIWKNGKKLAVAGLEHSGAVSFMLTWVGKGAGASSRAIEGAEIDGLDLRVGGIDSSESSGDQSVEWIEDTALRIGDDIQIRLVAAEFGGCADPARADQIPAGGGDRPSFRALREVRRGALA